MGLAGREQECVRLSRILRPQPRERLMVFLEGALGIGKTAVLDAVAASLECRVVRTGPAGPGGDGSSQALDRAYRSLGVVPVGDPVADAAALADALATEPTVLAVDDVHWADDAARAVLIALVLEAPDLVLVVAHRPTQVPHALLDAARRAGVRLDRVRLGGLADDRIAAIAGDVPDEGRARIVARADGNPLYGRLLTQLWWERPSVTAFEAALEGLRLDEMPSVYGALRADIRSLPPDTRSVLRAIAVIGRVQTDAVAAVTGLDEAVIAQACETLRGRELLAPGPRGIRISHPLLRAAAYRGTAPEDRLRAHRILAQMTGSVGELDRAEHLHLLGEHQRPEDVQIIVDAAGIALADDPRAAVRWLRSTVHVRHHARDVLLARALIVCADAAAAEDVLDALEHAESSDEVRGLRLQALRMAGRLEDAQQLLDEAVGVDDLAFQIERALLAVTRERWNEAVDGLERFARAHDDVESGSAALVAVAVLRTLGHLSGGDAPRARTEFAVASEGLDRASFAQWREALEVCAHAAWAAYLLEQYEIAAHIVDRALRVAAESGRVHARPHLHSVRAFVMVARGRLDEALRSADAALSDARKYAGPDAVSIAAAAGLFVAEWRGGAERLEGAAAALREAGRPEDPWWRRAVHTIAVRAEARTDPPRAVPMVDLAPDVLLAYRLLDAAAMHLALGSIAEARRLVAHARTVTAGLELTAQEAHVAMMEARLAADVDRELDEAIRIVSAARGVFEELAMPLHYERASVREHEYRARAEHSFAARLTRREREVADLVAQGLANKEIAAELSISPRTVEEHVGRVLGKLEVASRAAVGLALVG